MRCMCDLDALELRISETRVFQVRGTAERRYNPVTDRYTTSDPTRGYRPRAAIVGDKLQTPPAEKCDFDRCRTIPASLVADGDSVAIPDVADAIARGRIWLEQNGEVTPENFGALLDVFQAAWPPGAAVRTFPNVSPLPGIGGIKVINGFVKHV